MELSIATIRAQYPQPIRDGDQLHRDDTYCVGGALCLAARKAGASRRAPDAAFPGEGMLANVLADLNPALDTDDTDDIEETKAWEYAQGLIQANDEGNFEEAWRLAEEALAYRHRESQP